MKVLISIVLVAFACALAGPVEIDPQHDSCHWCRMTISSPRLAAQVVEPGEEPRLFDDLGCLSRELEHNARSARAPESSWPTMRPERGLRRKRRTSSAVRASTHQWPRI